MTRNLALLWRLASRALPARRRGWGEAFGAEIEHVPPGGPRLRWVIGGLRLVVRETHLVMKLTYLGAVSVGAGAILRYGWDAGPNPGTTSHRIALIATMSMLAVAPALSRRIRAFGPMADGVGPRLVRGFAFAAMWAVLPVAIYIGNYSERRFGTCADCTVPERAQWHSERVSSPISGSVAIFVILAAYAALILRITARRSGATSSTLAIGGVTGVISGVVLYGLTPAGSPLPVANTALTAIYHGVLLFAIPAGPFIAGVVAARRAGAAKDTGDSSDIAITQGIVAGTMAGAIGALLIAVLTIPTMVRFPHDVRLEWASPDPNIAHGTPFEVQMSAAIGHGGATVAYGIRAHRPDTATGASLLLGR
jgi:hypothetical protein